MQFYDGGSVWRNSSVDINAESLNQLLSCHHNVS